MVFRDWTACETVARFKRWEGGEAIAAKAEMKVMERRKSFIINNVSQRRGVVWGASQ